MLFQWHGVACTAGRGLPWHTQILPPLGRCQAGSWLSLLWSPSWASQYLGTPTPRPGSQGLCHSILCWYGSAGLAAACAMPCTMPVPACSCKTQLPPEGYSQHSLEHRRAMLSPSSPLGGSHLPLTTSSWLRGLAQLSQSGDANVSFPAACHLGSLGILQHYPSARVGIWLCTGRSRCPKVRQG